MRKTAMQELIDELYKRNSQEAWAYMSQVWPLFVEKEKQQIVDAYKQGANDALCADSGFEVEKFGHEQYYKLTFTQ